MVTFKPLVKPICCIIIFVALIVGDNIIVVDSGVVVTINGVTTDPASCFNSNDGEAVVQGGLVSGFTYTWETNISGPPAGFPNGDSPSGISVASG